MRSRLLAGSLLLALVPACGEPGAAPGPNLLLVIFDTTRADHLGCYGGMAETSPTVDALAARGTRFDEALSQSSLTPVSATSVLTGSYPTHHGVRSLFTVGHQTMDDGITPLAELLDARGIDTAAFVSAMPMNGKKYGLARGFGVYSDEPGRDVERAKQLGLPNAGQRRADDTTELALQWLDGRAGRRFGMLVHYFDAHDSTLVPPARFLAGRMTIPPPGVPPTEVQRIALYDAEIAFMDRELGRLLDRLKELGELDDTVVVVIGDHGEGLGQHGFWTHGLLWHEQLRVPLVLAGPGIPKGRLVADRVRLVDLLPTLVDLLDLPDTGQRDGSSLSELLIGGHDPAPRELYAEVHHAEYDFLNRDAAIVSITLGKWKYVHGSSGAHQLYDLEADPGETQNLFSEDHPQLPALRARLAELGALDHVRVSTEGMDPEDIETLRNLGYIEKDRRE